MTLPPNKPLPDPLLDRTLAHLANTAPAPDLNARLLGRLEAQAATQASRNFRPRWGWILLSVPSVAAAVLLALLLPKAPYPPSHDALTLPTPSELKRSQPAAEQKNHHLPEQTAQPGQGSRTSPLTRSKLNPSQLKASQLSSSQLNASQLQAEQEAPLLSAPPTKPSLKLQPLTQAEAQALDDLHAPSHPAPPLPPTAQERELSQILRLRGTVDIAELEPSRQAAAAAHEQRERHDFFETLPLPPPQGAPLDPAKH